MSKSRPISDVLPRVVENGLGKKGLLFGKMLAAWASIVGADLADKAVPVDLRLPGRGSKKGPGTLHVATCAAFSIDIVYQKEILIERLNMFFGYGAIGDIKIVPHSEVMDNKKSLAAISRPLTPPEEKRIETHVAAIEEKDLQEALKNLGKAILSRQNRSG